MFIKPFTACLINLYLALSIGNKPDFAVSDPFVFLQNVWAVGQAVPVALKGNLKSWDQLLQEWINSEGFEDNASLGVSIFALILSWFAWRSSDNQLAREKREEMRQILENILNLNEEWIQNSRQINDEVERIRVDLAVNRKKQLYLQAAEALAQQIQQVVSSTEFITLAEENINTGDYIQARLFFQNAVKASKRSSKIDEATALRYLAGNYFQREPKQFKMGRECFQSSIDCTESESDPYWICTQIIGYRCWAIEEINNGFLDQAENLLIVTFSKLDFLVKVSPGYSLEEPQRKFISSIWTSLGTKYYDCSKPKKGSTAMQKALEAIEKYDDSNEYATNSRGWIYWQWGEKELKLDQTQAKEYLLKSVEYFSKLRSDFQWRNFNLQQVENLLKPLSPNSLSEETISESIKDGMEENASESSQVRVNGFENYRKATSDES